ncbi:hypothetical protein TWF192_008453 [Orbilia oligospora]|uniref:Wax synthase domain-containing protein n=1 Tax=Orbilia oligospora TaxID=2813651 RepID=A0A6G1M3E0_ORBOL|nr:hypothetical protein TWF191_000126 [Orbilia oligospora]KAF3242985.1 hypothetical protein TWF192_008453 [Orbilia oligospora]
MLFASPFVPNNVQHYHRPPTYDFPDLPAADRASFWLLPISIALQQISLAIIGPLPKKSTIRTLLPAIVVPVVIGIGIQATLFSHHLTSPVVNFGYGTAAISVTLQGIEILFVTPWRYEIPLSEIFKIAETPCPTINPTWRQRFDWAGACLNNPRMLNTPFEPALLKKRREKVAGMSKGWFLVTRFARVVMIWVLIDFLLAWCRYDLWFGSATHHMALPDTLLSGAARTVFGGAAIWMAVDSEHALCAIVCVGLFGQDHSDWPDLFGIWTEEWYTIAEFWGIAWHGLFRQRFTFLTSTANSRVLRVVIPFLLSGVLHFAGAYMQSRHGVEAMMFLVLQPIGILAQQWIIGREGVKGRGWGVKCVVWVTTMVWLIATGYGFVGAYAKGGMFDIEPIPFSFLSLLGVVEGKVWRYGGAMAHFGWY